MALPLVAGDRLVGVLVMRDTHAAPEEIELDLPPLLADAALVVHNQILEHLHFERARRLAAIVECSDDAVIGKTLDGVVTSWNAGAEVIYSASASRRCWGSRSPGLCLPTGSTRSRSSLPGWRLANTSNTTRRSVAARMAS